MQLILWWTSSLPQTYLPSTFECPTGVSRAYWFAPDLSTQFIFKEIKVNRFIYDQNLRKRAVHHL
jgi:hypothetical protein